MPEIRRDVRFGRIDIVTIEGDVTEAVGEALENVGGGVVAGPRSARAFNLTLPIRGDGFDLDPYEAGARLRRQVRSLMDNPAARLESLYFRFFVDTELNGWLLVGGGDLSYGDGGVTLNDYILDLRDTYRIGLRRTHRSARRIEVYDRRLSTTPRDIMGSIYLTDFASIAGDSFHWLPPYATGPETVHREIVPVGGSRVSMGGALPVLKNRVHSEVVSFELSEELIYSASDVIVFDTRGVSPYQESVRTNLIANPNFETGTAGWSAYDLSGGDTAPLLAHDANQAKFGSRSLRIEIGENDDSKGVQTSSAFTISGHTLQASAWIKGDLASIGKRLRIRLVAGSIDTYTEYTLTPEWQRLSHVITGATATTATLFIESPDGHFSFWLDNVIVESPPNLVTNPHFETTDAGWVATNGGGGTGRTTAQFWAGVASYALVDSSGATIARTEGTTINVQPGETYTLVARIRASAASGSTGPAVVFKMNYQDSLAVPQVEFTDLAGSVWEERSMTFTVPRGKTTAEVWFEFGTSATRQGTIWLDGIELIRGRGQYGSKNTTPGATHEYLTSNILGTRTEIAPYFDGDFMWADWSGSAHASTSRWYGDPEDYGWEEIYGQNYPVSVGRPPVIQNGIVRCRPHTTAGVFILDSFYAGSGWVEQCRFYLRRITASGATATRYDTLSSSRVVEWTPERGVITATLGIAAEPGEHTHVYISLQRGWSGPRVEAYGMGIAMMPGVEVVFEQIDSNGGAWAAWGHLVPGAGIGSDEPSTTWNNIFQHAFASGSEPWVVLMPDSLSSAFDRVLTVGVMRYGERFYTHDSTVGYGSTRRAIGIRSNDGTAQEGYVSAHPALTRDGRLLEAETYINSGGTRTLVADATAYPGSGNSAVNDTQTAETAATVTISSGLLDSLGFTVGVFYGVWARVRVVTGGATLSARWRFGSASEGSIATTTSSSFIWVFLGNEQRQTGEAFDLRIWRSAGSGDVRIDRFAIVPTYSEITGRDAAFDHVIPALYDSRQVPSLVAR